MPFTPNFDIFYPCAGDNIDCTEFEVFTHSIQAALVAVDAAEQEVLRRPNARVILGSSAQTIAVNTATNVQFVVETFDNDSMADLAVNNERLTVQTAGIYLVAGTLLTGGPFTTLTSEALALSQNSVVRFRKKNHFNGNISVFLQTIGLFDCQVGDVLRLVYLWTGTGGPSGLFDATLTAQLVATR